MGGWAGGRWRRRVGQRRAVSIHLNRHPPTSMRELKSGSLEMRRSLVLSLFCRQAGRAGGQGWHWSMAVWQGSTHAATHAPARSLRGWAQVACCLSSWLGPAGWQRWRRCGDAAALTASTWKTGFLFWFSTWPKRRGKEPTLADERRMVENSADTRARGIGFKGRRARRAQRAAGTAGGLYENWRHGGRSWRVSIAKTLHRKPRVLQGRVGKLLTPIAPPSRMAPKHADREGHFARTNLDHLIGSLTQVDLLRGGDQ